MLGGKVTMETEKTNMHHAQLTTYRDKHFRGIFSSDNLQQSYIYIYKIHGGEEWTFPYLLLGTFRNEKNVLNTFISVCNIC